MSQRGRAGLAALALGLQFAVLYAPRAPAVDTGGVPVDLLILLSIVVVAIGFVICTEVKYRS